MSSFFNLELDTLAPQGVQLLINDGAQYVSGHDVLLSISTSDADTSGYQMKIWGIASSDSEGSASWETFSSSKSVVLPAGDGLKTVYLKLRDDVLNESSVVSAQIYVDTSVPVVTINYGPSVNRISSAAPANECSFSFVVDEDFIEFKIKVVPDTSSLHDSGVLISDANGSVSVSGVNEAGFPMNEPVSCKIIGADLREASGADGLKIVKVFARDRSGNWSVA